MASLSQNIGFKIYAGVLGAITTVASRKLVSLAWKAATGDTPPDPNDPDVDATQAAIWALASGIGLGVAQIAMNRFLARRYEAQTGEPLDTNSRSKIKL